MEDMIYTQNIAWRKLREFPGTAEVKMLHDSAEGGARTMLVRLPPGGQIVPHAHLGVVQHYVLEGTYQTRGQTCPAGSLTAAACQCSLSPMAASQNGWRIACCSNGVPEATTVREVGPCRI